MKVGVQKETLLGIIYLTLICFIRTAGMWLDQNLLAVTCQQKPHSSHHISIHDHY